MREVMDLLLWDEQSGSFDLSRLPPTASPDLLSLYRPESKAGPQDWFNMLSDMPGCDYLTESPDGRPYELTPTLSNVALVCQKLLYKTSDAAADADWTSLKDLQKRWKPSSQTRRSDSNRLNITFDTLSHRAAMSDDMIHHEIATLWFDDGKYAIELRLRLDRARNTGFATVTHMRQQQQSRLESNVVDQFHHAFLDARSNDSLALKTLALALSIGDHHHSAPCSPTLEDSENRFDILLDVLSTHYGPDRRYLMRIASTSDLEREENARKVATKESQDVLKAAITNVCHALNNNSEVENEDISNTMRGLLVWLLSETPTVVEELPVSRNPDPDIENAILSLPFAIVNDKATKSLVKEHWACRGNALITLIQMRAGETSAFNLLKNLSFSEMLSLASLYRTQNRLV